MVFVGIAGASGTAAKYRLRLPRPAYIWLSHTLDTFIASNYIRLE